MPVLKFKIYNQKGTMFFPVEACARNSSERIRIIGFDLKYCGALKSYILLQPAADNSTQF